MRKNIKNKGFTIVELIVVMAIIAILILMAVPTFTKYIENAKKTSEMGTADTIFKASLAAVLEDYTEPLHSTVKVGAVADNAKIVIDTVGGVDGEDHIKVYGYTTEPTNRNSNTPEDYWEVYIKSTADVADATGTIYVISPLGNIYKNGDLFAKASVDDGIKTSDSEENTKENTEDNTEDNTEENTQENTQENTEENTEQNFEGIPNGTIDGKCMYKDGEWMYPYAPNQWWPCIFDHKHPTH